MWTSRALLSPTTASIVTVNLEPIFDPRKRRLAPSPAHVGMRILFLSGTILFALLTIGFAVAENYFNRPFGYKFWVCLFGFLIGLILLVWEHFNRSTYMKLANDDESIEGISSHFPHADRSQAGARTTAKKTVSTSTGTKFAGKSAGAKVTGMKSTGAKITSAKVANKSGKKSAQGSAKKSGKKSFNRSAKKSVRKSAKKQVK